MTAGKSSMRIAWRRSSGFSFAHDFRFSSTSRYPTVIWVGRKSSSLTSVNVEAIRYIWSPARIKTIVRGWLGTKNGSIPVEFRIDGRWRWRPMGCRLRAEDGLDPFESRRVRSLVLQRQGLQVLDQIVAIGCHSGHLSRNPYVDLLQSLS